MKVSKQQLKFQSVKSQIREFVETRMRGAVLSTIYEIFNQEMDELCGPRHSDY